MSSLCTAGVKVDRCVTSGRLAKMCYSGGRARRARSSKHGCPPLIALVLAVDCRYLASYSAPSIIFPPLSLPLVERGLHRRQRIASMKWVPAVANIAVKDWERTSSAPRCALAFPPGGSQNIDSIVPSEVALGSNAVSDCVTRFHVANSRLPGELHLNLFSSSSLERVMRYSRMSSTRTCSQVPP